MEEKTTMLTGGFLTSFNKYPYSTLVSALLTFPLAVDTNFVTEGQFV